jgi:hypothetical protein
MSEDVGTNNEQTRAAIERILPKAVRELEELIDNGGKKNVRYTCDGCGKQHTIEVKVADSDMLVKSVSALSSALPRMQSKGDDTSTAAQKILSDFSEMTNAELAEYLARLEAEDAN